MVNNVFVSMTTFSSSPKLVYKQLVTFHKCIARYCKFNLNSFGFKVSFMILEINAYVPDFCSYSRPMSAVVRRVKNINKYVNNPT